MRLHPAIRAYSPRRSRMWPRVRREHLKKEPACRACGGTKTLQVHHIHPFHLHPELELASGNLITLCEQRARNCHLAWGHFHNWKLSNPVVRQDVERYYHELQEARHALPQAGSSSTS